MPARTGTHSRTVFPSAAIATALTHPTQNPGISYYQQ